MPFLTAGMIHMDDGIGENKGSEGKVYEPHGFRVDGGEYVLKCITCVGL